MLTVDRPASFVADPLLWVAIYSPLHLFWAGNQAVYVFFALSGFVLVWPYLNGRRIEWAAWYAQRFARLYLPIWVGAGLSYIVYLAVDRPVQLGMSHWMLLHAGRYFPVDFLRDLSLLDDVSPILNTAYWSLRWEVVYSFVVPVVLLILVKVRSQFIAICCSFILVSAIVFGTRGGDAFPASPSAWNGLTYLPIFLLGALAARRSDDLENGIALLERRRMAIPALWFGAVGAILWPLEWKTSEWLPSLRVAVPACGALLLIALFAFSTSGRRLGQKAICAWLGQRAFSIYLIHGPIVVGLAYLFYPHQLPWIMLITALPLSIAAGALFFVLVERPLHILSVKVGRRVSDATARNRADMESLKT